METIYYVTVREYGITSKNKSFVPYEKKSEKMFFNKGSLQEYLEKLKEWDNFFSHFEVLEIREEKEDNNLPF